MSKHSMRRGSVGSSQRRLQHARAPRSSPSRSRRSACDRRTPRSAAPAPPCPSCRRAAAPRCAPCARRFPTATSSSTSCSFSSTGTWISGGGSGRCRTAGAPTSSDARPPGSHRCALRPLPDCSSNPLDHAAAAERRTPARSRRSAPTLTPNTSRSSRLGGRHLLLPLAHRFDRAHRVAQLRRLLEALSQRALHHPRASADRRARRCGLPGTAACRRPPAA